MGRPLSALSIDQLEFLFADSQGSKAQLQDILFELKHRTTSRARDLKTRIEGLISTKTTAGSGPAVADPIREGVKQTALRQNPTSEQIECVAQFKTGSSLRISAFAGSGKTSTLKMLAESTNARGVYLAFNRKAKEDAQSRFPKSVSCLTTYGLAYKAMMGRFSSDKLTRHINANELSEAIGLRDVKLGPNRVLRSRTFAYLINETIRKFGYSAAESPLAVAVPRPDSFHNLPDEGWSILERYMQNYANATWTRMCNSADPLPLGHDGYLKQWALSHPRIIGDFVMLDEAQDTNPVMLNVVQEQKSHSQLVCVGDKYQQIYEWRGAINAMESISCEHECYLTK